MGFVWLVFQKRVPRARGGKAHPSALLPISASVNSQCCHKSKKRQPRLSVTTKKIWCGAQSQVRRINQEATGFLDTSGSSARVL